MFKIKRAYEEPSSKDGFRVLIDRLWPRGITKDAAKLDLWLKDVAPSSELRTWFHHNPAANWATFKKQYRAELAKLVEPVELLKKKGKRRTVTLVYGAKDPEYNHALVLREYLEQ
jgi:uncharacterized protein YeaO (DUF488 family)